MPHRRRRLSSAGPSLLAARLFPLLALALAPRPARAQERLRFELFADDRLYRTTLQPRQGDPQILSGAVVAGLGASAMRGPGAQSFRPLSGFAGVDAGLWAAPTCFLQLSTSGLVPIPTSAAGAQGAMRARDLEGQAQVRMLLGTSDIKKGVPGGDVEFEGNLLQTGRYTTSVLRRDVGAVPFREGWMRATLWPRIGSNRDDAVVMPIAYALRHLDYGEEGISGAPSGKLTSHRVASGIGIKPYEKEFVHGWIQFLGVAWEKTHTEPSRGSAGKLRSVERVDLDALRLDGLVASIDRMVDINMSSAFGGSWLWDRETGERASTFTFTVASAIHAYLDREHEKGRVGGGIGVSRRAGVLADGSALTRGWRLEGRADVELLKRRTGGSLRWVSEQLTLPLLPEDRRDRGFLHALASEWFIAPLAGLQIGVQHLSTQRCLAPWTPTGGAFCHQIGTFVRLVESGGITAAVTPPKAPRPSD